MSFKSYHLAIAGRLVEDRQRLDAQVHVPLIQALEKLEDDPYRGERCKRKKPGLGAGVWETGESATTPLATRSTCCEPGTVEKSTVKTETVDT